MQIHLEIDEARELHAALEELLETGASSPNIEKLYRNLGWRLLAVSGGTGLTARISEVARDSRTLEEYETTRDRELGPILDGLERGENRDP